MKKTKHRGTILVVDDDKSVVEYLVEMLERADYNVAGVTSPHNALDLIKQHSFDLVIADIEMPSLRGPELLKAILAMKPKQLVMFITAFGSIDLSVQMIKAGACDFIAKPFKNELLLIACERAIRERNMYREIVRLSRYLPDAGKGGLIAQSASMHHVLEVAAQAAKTDLTVLITGESGVGKGALARFIHQHSSRAKGPLVQINCAALPGQLVESELFGVRRGAFTDAREDREGLFLKATNGTLVLDEVGEMALNSQPKLLHALETASIRHVGGTEEKAINARIIATTNRPLEEALKQKTFRPDLYYRLNSIRIEIPPLRQRLEDVEGLIDLFFHQYTTKLQRPLAGISAKAMHRLLTYQWPGNVRELANAIQRAVALTEHDTIILDDIVLEQPSSQNNMTKDFATEHHPLADVEREYIQSIITKTGGNKKLAAEILGIDRRTLYRKLEGATPDKKKK